MRCDLGEVMERLENVVVVSTVVQRSDGKVGGETPRRMQ